MRLDVLKLLRTHSHTAHNPPTNTPDTLPKQYAYPSLLVPRQANTATVDFTADRLLSDNASQFSDGSISLTYINAHHTAVFDL
jgi:hypothetical protein